MKSFLSRSKLSHSIKKELIFISFVPTLLIFLVIFTVNFHIQQKSVEENIHESLNNVINQKETEFNNCFSSVEQAVNVLSAHVLDTIDEKRLLTDKKYEKEYMDILCKVSSNIASVPKDSVAVYFRLEEKKYGGKAGVFLTGNSKNGFISVSPTDLHAYSPTDIEHVCWYYVPVWAGKAVWIEPYANKNINMHILSYVRPLYKNGELLGVVGIDINLATIKNISDNIKLDEFSVLLIGAERNLVYNTDSKVFLHLKQENNEIRNLRPFFEAENKNSFQSYTKNGKNYYGTSRILQNHMYLIISVPDTAIKKSRNIFMLRNLTIMFLALSAGVAVVLYCFKKILNPVSDLTKAAWRLSRGELGIPIVYESDNEIGLLSDSIRKMAVQLKEYIDFIREQTISERQAKEAAIQASKAKSDFLANMSHEIRTPINAVLGMDEMILRENTDSTINQYAMTIKQAGNSLLSIINDVLDFSKIESGKMELFPQSYDLTVMLVDIITIISERAKNKELEFILKINPNIPRYLIGDSLRIKQCILNLLTNAVKYTHEGHIEFFMGFTKDPATNELILSISVSDTGIGIKSEDLEKLFAPFERIEENRNRTIEGTGLGMNIVQKLLSLMDSKLDVKSEYGKGSTFSFSIKQLIQKEEVIGDIMESYRKTMASTKKYKEKLIAPDVRLLFVDDTKMNLEVIKGLLKYTKMQIDTVASGKEALEKVKDNYYHILFIDHRMPEMDGIQTLEAMKKMPGNRSLTSPTIALTANAIEGAREMYLKAGFTDYLSKPVSPIELEAILRKYIPGEMIFSPLDDEDIPESKPALPEVLLKLQGLNIENGLKFCGNTDIYVDMAKLFYKSINANADELENFVKNDDIDNFRIKVHALKSTSRLIGAEELSAKAEKLEKEANEKNLSFIHENFPELLVLYRSYIEKLSNIMDNEESIEKVPKKTISSEDFMDKLKTLYAIAEDFNSLDADSWFEEMTTYAIPEEHSDLFEKISQAIEKVDFYSIKELLKDIVLS
ncbi:MAG: response regulator [Treponema sp.]|nr:response regulator [Treponema sp.]